MSWPLSLLVAALTAAVVLMASGAVAGLCVEWYRISSFEGGSGYFVVGMALLGGIAGAIIGLIAARTVTGFLHALGTANGIALGVLAIIAAVARLLADVPPTIDGDNLVLAVEVQWPASQQERPVSTGTREPRLELGALTGNTRRVYEPGAFWVEDVKQVDGRWVAPGAVYIFTNRGKRVISAIVGDSTIAGLLLPLRTPKRTDMEWSAWMPRARDGKPPLPDGFRIRYRVVKSGTPVRGESLGNLEIRTRARSFSESGDTITAYASFDVLHNGKPVAITKNGGSIKEIAALPAAPHPTLIAHVEEDTEQTCHLIVDEGDSARIVDVGACYGLSTLKELTVDPVRYARSKSPPLIAGRFDRHTLDGVRYLLPGTVLDVGALAAHPFKADDDAAGAYAPVLAVSPDGRSLARFGYAESNTAMPMLVVTDVVAGTSYRVPVDAAGMRMPKFDHLDPAWANHYFTWHRGADGIDRLTAQAHPTPLPYRGRLEGSKDEPYYWIEPATAALRDTLVQYLVTTFGGERLPVEEYSDERKVRVHGVVLRVGHGGDSKYVSVFLDYNVKDSALIPDIAKRFDAELATGKYDALFTSW